MPKIAGPGTQEPRPAQQPQWLSADEQDAWKAVLTLLLLMPGPLDGQLQRESGISLFEYVVLSAISNTPERTVRMSELAALVNGSLSRLSNVVKRLEQRGWVHRKVDPQDGRCTVATLTDTGWDLVVAAAPGHVEAVRHYVIDPLTAAQLRTVAAIGGRIRSRLCSGSDRQQCIDAPPCDAP